MGKTMRKNRHNAQMALPLFIWRNVKVIKKMIIMNKNDGVKESELLDNTSSVDMQEGVHDKKDGEK